MAPENRDGPSSTADYSKAVNMPITPREIRRERQKALPPVDRYQRYEISETSTYLRQSDASTWADIKSGALKVIREGGRTYVPGSEIIRRSTLPQEVA